MPRMTTWIKSAKAIVENNGGCVSCCIRCLDCPCVDIANSGCRFSTQDPNRQSKVKAFCEQYIKDKYSDA